jgi:uncharacterized protein YceH (UPF0502 family)
MSNAQQDRRRLERNRKAAIATSVEHRQKVRQLESRVAELEREVASLRAQLGAGADPQSGDR